MTNEQLRMQMLAGVITEGEYAAIINKQIEEADKESLNESMIGGIVGVGAINQIPATPKTDYEMAFEHFLGERYEVKPNRERDDIKDVNEAEGMVDSNILKSYINQMISLADDMEYTPEMVDELENLKNTLSNGSMSKEDALNIAQKTIDITGDDIDAAEALNQAISGDYELGEGKEDTTYSDTTKYAWKVYDFLKEMFPEVGEDGRMIKILESAIRIIKSSNLNEEVGADDKTNPF